MLQFVNMEVMKLIICSESWKYPILFNSFIFGIALRNKHIKVNIFSESSLCGLIRVLQTKTNIFCLPSQHISMQSWCKWHCSVYHRWKSCCQQQHWSHPQAWEDNSSSHLESFKQQQQKLVFYLKITQVSQGEVSCRLTLFRFLHLSSD